MKIICILVIILICQQFVSCQVTKQLYYSDSSCSSDPFVTIYLETGSCAKTTCYSMTLGGRQVYLTQECGNSEISSSTSTTTTDITVYTYKNGTSCNGQPKSAQIIPLYKCIIEYGTTYYSIYEPSGSGSKTYFYDSTCKSKMFTAPLFLNTCLPGNVMYATKALRNGAIMEKNASLGVIVLSVLFSLVSFMLI